MTFDYGSFTGRNIGFVDQSKQQLLREASVFVCDCRGWFLNPYRPAIERPRNVIAAAMMRPFVRRAIHQLTERP